MSEVAGCWDGDWQSVRATVEPQVGVSQRHSPVRVVDAAPVLTRSADKGQSHRGDTRRLYVMYDTLRRLQASILVATYAIGLVLRGLGHPKSPPATGCR
jgi:hypothetical protein